MSNNHKRIAIALVIASLALFLWREKSWAGSSIPSATTHTVQIANFAFSPATLTIQEGDTVQWTWVNGFHSTTSGACPSGICSPNGIWDSGSRSAPSTFSRTFNTTGTFTYYCSVHLAAMQGTIIVQPAPVAPSEVPEADTLVLMLGGGMGAVVFLVNQWRHRRIV